MMRFAISFLACAAPAFAQDVSVIPPNCEAFVTVQQRSCQVRSLYRCDGDREGDLHRVEFDAEGHRVRATIDREAQWIVTEYPGTGFARFFVPSSDDPMSLSVVLAGEVDQYHFQMANTNGDVQTYRGYDRLVGEEVEIDGVRLLVSEYSIQRTTEEGVVDWEARGTEYIHPEWRTFVAGIGESAFEGTRSFYDDTPVEFWFPGEDGFLDHTPRYDCEDEISDAGALQVLPLSEG